MSVAYFFVLNEYWKLLNLLSELGNSTVQSSIEREIVELLDKNPKLMTIITRATVFMVLILFIAKII